MDQNNIVTDIENAPWYQSTQGPKVAGTVKALSGLIVPILMQTGLIKTGLPWLDSVIDVACIAGFGGYALYTYARAKTTLGATIKYWKREAINVQGK